jgi:hypothetical protein
MGEAERTGWAAVLGALREVRRLPLVPPLRREEAQLYAALAGLGAALLAVEGPEGRRARGWARVAGWAVRVAFAAGRLTRPRS